MFLFVVLFGLSMDYHVFIVSRIKELVDAGETTEDAVLHGITRTAPSVTSAAAVMVAVFGIFATLTLLQFKQMGLGPRDRDRRRRDGRPRGAAPGDDEAARRLELVPARLAGMAAARGRPTPKVLADQR